MIIEYDNNYGADRDGNRGMAVTYYEEEESDIQEWLEDLYNEGYDELPYSYEWHTFDPHTEIDIEITISPRVWITETFYENYKKNKDNESITMRSIQKRRRR